MFLVFVVVTAFIQVRTTNVQDLVYLDNDEQRVQQMRLREYPLVRITLFGKTLWIPAAHWLEERKEVIIFYRLEKNFFETIDPNLYFFSNHPRERIGVSEFEKFAYIVLPIFLYGLYLVIKKKRYFLLAYLFISLGIISVIGHDSLLGPFLLFPFISLSVFVGLIDLHQKTRKNRLLTFSFLVIYILSLIQIFSYGII
jgi:hypothetical protein